MSKDRTDVHRASIDTDGTQSGVETTSPEIECCIDNIDVQAQEAIEASDKSVDTQYCLQRCGICYKTPFFVVDGHVSTGEDHRALLDKLDTEEGKHE